MPSWLARDVLDIRSTMLQYLSYQPPWAPETPVGSSPLLYTSTQLICYTPQRSSGLTCRSLNISAQLKVLGLPAFEGREHSGIDVGVNMESFPTVDQLSIGYSQCLQSPYRTR